MKEHRFLESFSGDPIPGHPVIVGCPLDLTSTFRSGCADGPSSIRIASESIESYSPLLDKDLLDSPFSDIGDIDFSGASLERALELIRKAISRLLPRGSSPLCIGGEHTISLPAVRAVKALYRELLIVHVDAHSDLRDHYEGSFINHATVMKRIDELMGPGRLIQLGVRSGTREEMSWMRESGTMLQWNPVGEQILLNRIGDRPVYLTLDLDVLDPSCFPGTGNPEPGGWFYADMERLFWLLDRVNLVAADVVELNPGLDPSEVSSITAAKIVRELLLILAESSRRRNRSGESLGVDTRGLGE